MRKVDMEAYLGVFDIEADVAYCPRSACRLEAGEYMHTVHLPTSHCETYS